MRDGSRIGPIRSLELTRGEEVNTFEHIKVRLKVGLDLYLLRVVVRLGIGIG